MATLVIAQIPGVTPARFEIVRQPDGKRAPAVEVPSPYEVFPTEPGARDNLMVRLAWYLERFLEYPFPPSLQLAADVEDALEGWGHGAFNALFGSGSARDWMTAAKRSRDFRIWISSDDPAVHSWPWEALCDPELGAVAHRAQIERRLNYNLADPLPLSERLPRNRINILLVTARPYARDVQFRSISRPLVELIKTAQLPVELHLLRPPTLDELRSHLQRHPNHYHILHFDGHGGWSDRRINGSLR